MSDTTNLTALAEVFREILSASDSIAIPGFGTFTPEKKDEYVAVTDDGKRMLMPPSISITLKPGSRLRKTASNNL